MKFGQPRNRGITYHFRNASHASPQIEPAYNPEDDLCSDEENDEEVVSFVADMVPYLKSIPDAEEASLENERLRASKILPRKEFLQVRDQELTALHTFLGDKFFNFQRELMPHFSRKIPPKERGLYDLPVENYTFSKMFGIKSHSEMICSVLLPELLTKFVMQKEGVDRIVAASRIFGTQGGHTIYDPCIKAAEKANKTEQTCKKSRRKTVLPRKIVRE